MPSFKRPISSASRYIPDAEVDATVDQFRAIGEDPDRVACQENGQ
jgi:hypothetical protein